MKRDLEIIAELAQGFEGSEPQALSLLHAASAAGADAAKFQVIYADELCTPDYEHYKLFKSLEMPVEAWQRIAAKAKNLGISLVFDVFGSDSLELANEVGVSRLMLHATDLSNLNLLSLVNKTDASDVFLGIGGGHRTEIKQAIKLLNSKNVILMAGFQGYPTPLEDNQISRIGVLHREFAEKHENVQIGFADHSLPNSSSLLGLMTMAFASGAIVLEKHLTLAGCMKLEDHEAAINPDEFQQFVIDIRACRRAFGQSGCGEDFGMAQSEKTYRSNMRRKVVAAEKISAGKVINSLELTLKRGPGEDHFSQIGQVEGLVSKKQIERGMVITREMVG